MIDWTNHADDLVAAYVLGAVTPEEAARVEAHLATCAQCRLLERDLREVEASLPLLAEDAAPPPELKSRLMAAIVDEPPGQGLPTASIATLTPPRPDAEEAPPAPVTPVPLRPGWRTSRLWPLLAAAVLAVILVAVVVWRATTLTETTPTREYAMTGTSALPSVRGKLYYYKSDQRLVVDLSGLKQIPANKVYEMWLIRGTSVVKGVKTFQPGANGTAHLTLTSYAVQTFTLSGLTIERAPGASTPTLPIVALAKLTG